MSGILPHGLEWLFSLESESGEGTTWALENAWRWPPWVTLLLLLFCVAWVAYFYSRESATVSRGAKTLLALLRLASILLVLFMIAEFLITFERTGLPVMVVMIDDSASMGIVDRPANNPLGRQVADRLTRLKLDEPTRLNLAKTLLLNDDTHWLESLARHYQLKVYCLSTAARARSAELATLVAELRNAEPEGTASRLGDGLRRVLGDLRGSPPAAVIVLTDGITTDGETLGQAAVYARRKGVPLYAIGLGSPEPVRDVELSDLLVDELVFVDDVVNFQATLTATGFAGQQVTLSLHDQNDEQPLAQRQVTLAGDGQPLTVRLPYRPSREGQFEYVVSVTTLPDEAREDNNVARRAVTVRKEKVRVLFVQAYPNYEYHYLKNMLERDPTIELESVLQEADLEYAAIDQSARAVFPVRRDELFAYDVLLFGDVNPDFLSASVMRNVRDFVVAKGGGMVVMAGPAYTPQAFHGTPIEPLFPVVLDDIPATPPTASEPFQLTPTDLGLATPAMQLGDTSDETLALWQSLAPLYWYLETPRLKPAARVLAVHPERKALAGGPLPLVSMHYVGAGKVLFHATDETWRWRFRLGDVLFARYWVQTIRYLARSKLLGDQQLAELTVDRREYRRGEPVRVRLRFLDDRQAPATDDGVMVVVDRHGDRSRRLPLRRSASGRGIFEGVLTDVREGRYHAWVARPQFENRAPSANFVVAVAPHEFQQVQMDARDLGLAAERSRGKFYTLATAPQLLDDLPAGRPVPVESLPPRRLWNHSLVLGLLLASLIGEWILRKRKALL